MTIVHDCLFQRKTWNVAFLYYYDFDSIIIIIIILVSGFRMQCMWAYVEASVFQIYQWKVIHPYDNPLMSSFLTLIIWSLPKLLPGSCLSM